MFGRVSRWLALPVAALLASPVAATATPPQVERAAVRVARAVDGTIRPCPTNFRNFTESRQCISAPHDTETIKVRLNRAFEENMVTAWRTQSNPVYSFNYVRHENEVVGVVVGPLARDGSTSILVLDAVQEKANPKPATPEVRIVPRREATAPAPSATSPAARAPTTATKPATPPAKATPSGESVANARATAVGPAFGRELALRSPRMSGEDVRSLQNRLMDVAGMQRGGGGDGWYGPVTAATVRVFQRTNGLPDTGRVDRVTWERLFSARARAFDPEDVNALLGR